MAIFYLWKLKNKEVWQYLASVWNPYYSSAYANDIAGLREFEREAIPIVRRAGGELLAAIELVNPKAWANIPDENHQIQFPPQAAFDACWQSPKAVTHVQ